MRRVISVPIVLILLLALVLPARAASKTELETALNDAGKFILGAVSDPQVDSVGGEWAVIGLARSGCEVPDSYFANYYKTVEKYVKDRGGVLHDVKYTEYSRVILGLTAAGYDPRDVAGFDLTAPLADFGKTVSQGINGPIFALISLAGGKYPNPAEELYIAEILRRQLPDGGFNLTAGGGGKAIGANEKGDPDITGMALQALAKYRDRKDVNAAADKALLFLSGIQDEKGGFSGGFSGGSPVLESAAQVLIALCELGIPVDDPRFVKNGNTLTDNILSFKNQDGGFSHTRGGVSDLMSSEQALCALAAAKRAAEGNPGLYSPDDAAKSGGFVPPPAELDLPVKLFPVVIKIFYGILVRTGLL
ncbi:MAG: hypothetical protein FWG32_04905 [Oscillospiraceae bacterium]|nr:hypothetical protein [Oscillospiraceae bacterium]